MSNESHPPLPSAAAVNVRVLARIFNNTTNSYKFLFFLALLETLENNAFSAGEEITIDELVIDMLVLAWYPHVYFKLSFGEQDKVTRELAKLTPSSINGKFNPWNREAIRTAIKGAIPVPKELARYVPYRLIRPFFPEIKARDHEVNGLVCEAAEQQFTVIRPLYKFNRAATAVIVHPAWLDYIKNNFALVRDWASWNYLQYMQAVNPLVPSLSLKLFPPAERESLVAQTKYWKPYLAQNEVHCIYSGQRLSPDQMALDHFIPWSFLVHNDLWNLIPASPSANSSKSDSLPHPRYKAPFIDMQHIAYTQARQNLPDKAAEDYSRQFQHWLKLDSSELRSREKFVQALNELLDNHLMLAEVNGFQPNWTHSGSQLLT